MERSALNSQEGKERVEFKSVLASAPGRICFAGESLDWMTGGPSIVAAIDLRTMVSVRALPQDNQLLSIYSGYPFNSEKILSIGEIDKYDQGDLKYVLAALKSLIRSSKPLEALSLEISTELPIKAGVSSSASVTLATVAALNAYLETGFSQSEVCSLAFSVESQELKTGVGQMDFYACGMGGLRYLDCSSEPPSTQDFNTPDVSVILVDTLVPHLTKSFGSAKRIRFQEGEPAIHEYAKLTEETVYQMRDIFLHSKNNIEEIGEQITRCHEYLRDYVQCSTDLLDQCVETCLQGGAYGAKLTGSGMGGCMFALASEDNSERIKQALSELPVKVYLTNISKKGILLHTPGE